MMTTFVKKIILEIFDKMQRFSKFCHFFFITIFKQRKFCSYSSLEDNYYK